MPLADVVLRREDLAKPEPVFPLELVFCAHCSLLQLSETVPPELIYGAEYPYYTSVLPGLTRHFTECAEQLIERFGLGPGDHVVEIGSNDGYMLRTFVAHGMSVLGVDPVPGPARVAQENGVPTVCEFFGSALAERLSGEGVRADVLIANNMLTLVNDAEGFARGIALLLAPQGVAVIQGTSPIYMIDDCAFDMVFHQNIGYFSVTAAARLFRRVGLHLNRIEQFPEVMGGSVRMYFGPSDRPDPSVRETLDAEQAKGVDEVDYYRRFGTRAEALKVRLRTLLEELRRDGSRIAAYGAGGGMATTLLNYVMVDPSIIEYAVDGNPHKHGCFTPGTHLEIHPPSRLVEDRPDYVLLLAWNYADEIVSSQAEYRAQGGRFIIPIPEPCII